MRKDVNAGDIIFRGLTRAVATLVVVILVVVVIALTTSSRDTLVEYGPSFVTSSDWNAVEGREAYGALPAIFGTLVTAFFALIIAVPISLGIAVFLAELAPEWLRRPLSFLVELLAAVPSVIYGLWGFFVLRPLLVQHVDPAISDTFGAVFPFFHKPDSAQGNDIFLASVILAIMILPTISSVTREVLRAVPDTQREGALALGATRWETVRAVVLPFARSGITGAIILGLGRALGETMAVTMLIGNGSAIPSSIFQPATTMASKIANNYGDAEGKRLSALIELGLILFVITFALNVFARLLVRRVGRVPEGARA